MRSLIYISHSTQSFTESRLKELEVNAIKNNADFGITGFLCFHNDTFIQYIEGDIADIDKLFSRLNDDDRHSIVFHLIDDSHIARRFPSWEMRFIDPKDVDISIEPFLYKKLEMISEIDMNAPDWQDLIWRGVDILAKA